jgi:hypothetical protein
MMPPLAQFDAGVSVYWYLLPLVVVVSLVYSATRHEELPLIFGRAARLSVLILAFMGLTLLALLGLQSL